MKHSTVSATTKTNIAFISGAAVMLALFFLSLFVGKYPLVLSRILAGDSMQVKVFLTLRLSRAVVGLIGGFALGIAGFVYQTIFHNALASPDIIGVSSGASAGAAAGILFFQGATMITVCAFGGAIIAVVFALLLSTLDKSGRKSTVILAGIAVHSLAQTVLMCFKLVADPEKQLASIEYWIMGSLNGINSHIIGGNIAVCLVCLVALFVLHRQSILLATEETEAKMLGVNIFRMRLLLLIFSTITVSCIVSMTGLISFIGLLAPHSARKITGNNHLSTMILGGIVGSCLLLGADILARSVAATELPVSIFTSILGAPFLIILIFRGRQKL
ncbi:MAG: iron ABC transporter permease [Lachnospiraceae bacterium]|nr:iron ABC transporter permease [Lachnospiraceae bacterium]